MSFIDVQLGEFQLLLVSGVDLLPGGLSQGDSIGHLRVVDAPRGKAYMVPMNRLALNSLAGQIEKVLSDDEEVTDADVEDAEE